MKPKIGDTVQFKKSGIIGTVEKILRGVCIVDTHVSKLSAWPEDLIICGLSEVSLDNDMQEHQKICDEIMAIQGIEPIEAEMEEVWHCPEGYIFKDENGNVINATKIVLEKKKKEYPKTFEECVHVLEGGNRMSLEQMNTFRKLIDARNAYWKLYGEEMGLGKGLPWVPDWMCIDPIYIILYQYHAICKAEVNGGTSYILAFPTAEMRDVFYENFKELIEQCKELL